jgi:signal transduction histidine kinase
MVACRTRSETLSLTVPTGALPGKVGSAAERPTPLQPSGGATIIYRTLCETLHALAVTRTNPWPMALVVAITFAGASLLNAWLATRQVAAALESRLRESLQTLEAADFPLESAVLRQASGLTGAQFALADEAGVFLAASREDLQSSNHVQPPTTPRELRLDRVELLGGEPFLATTVLLDRSPRGGRRYLLDLYYPQRVLLDAQRQALWPPLLVGVGAVLLVVAAASWVASRVTQPVRRLTEQVRRISAGEFSPAEPPVREDEVRDLGLAVNDMARRLAQYESEVRAAERLQTLAQLGGGIAHQVRNAATGCRLAIDLHRQACPASGDEDEPLIVAAQQLELIETHVHRLLALGRNQPGESNLGERREIDLTDVLASAVALVAPLAQHLGIDLQTPPRGAENAKLLGDPHELQQLLLNLLTNAIQAAAAARAYSSREARVVVRFAEAPAEAHALEFGDTGDGPSPAIAARLFEPFASDKPGGTGLGLSVARRIARAHGGDVTWRREANQTWFRLHLLRKP